ncbi:hypothetical protein HK097_005687, partial [Rhizophlyctis rosea]
VVDGGVDGEGDDLDFFDREEQPVEQGEELAVEAAVEQEEELVAEPAVEEVEEPAAELTAKQQESEEQGDENEEEQYEGFQVTDVSADELQEHAPQNTDSLITEEDTHPDRTTSQHSFRQSRPPSEPNLSYEIYGADEVEERARGVALPESGVGSRTASREPSRTASKEQLPTTDQDAASMVGLPPSRAQSSSIPTSRAASRTASKAPSAVPSRTVSQQRLLTEQDLAAGVTLPGSRTGSEQRVYEDNWDDQTQPQMQSEQISQPGRRDGSTRSRPVSRAPSFAGIAEESATMHYRGASLEDVRDDDGGVETASMIPLPPSRVASNNRIFGEDEVGKGSVRGNPAVSRTASMGQLPADAAKIPLPPSRAGSASSVMRGSKPPSRASSQTQLSPKKAASQNNVTDPRSVPLPPSRAGSATSVRGSRVGSRVGSQTQVSARKSASQTNVPDPRDVPPSPGWAGSRTASGRGTPRQQSLSNVNLVGKAAATPLPASQPQSRNASRPSTPRQQSASNMNLVSQAAATPLPASQPQSRNASRPSTPRQMSAADISKSAGAAGGEGPKQSSPKLGGAASTRSVGSQQGLSDGMQRSKSVGFVGSNGGGQQQQPSRTQSRVESNHKLEQDGGGGEAKREEAEGRPLDKKSKSLSSVHRFVLGKSESVR